MAHTIMFIPVTLNVEPKLAVLNLHNFLTKKTISSSIFPEFDLENMEKLLAANNSEELLADIAKQHGKLAAKNGAILISGIPLNKPYAAELNFSLATALGSAVIFIIAPEQNLEITLRQLKIVANPYRFRYKLPVLGCLINKDSFQLTPGITKIFSDLQIPLLGTVSENSTQHELLENADCAIIKKFLDKNIIQPVTPALFKTRLIELAKQANKKIVLPEGDEPRTIEAANICAAHNIAQCILLGEKDKIYTCCNKLNLKLHEKITIVEPQTVIEKYVTPLYELRRAKGLTLDEARKQLQDNVVLGTMMLHLNGVDGLVSGAVHSTANTIRPALQIIKTPPNVKLVSSVFFICLPDQVLVYGDCAVNPNPNAEELADIAIQSANSALAFGITPKIAMLSYSTGTSGTGESVDKVKAATEIVKTLRPDLAIDGPLQYDAAISEETALIKAPHSKVAGHATVFIMPNLDVGNISYKTVQRSTGIVCVGPMLQGLRKPVNDLSRGCLVDDIVFTIAITAIQAQSTPLATKL